MSLKIHISYTEDAEAKRVLTLLEPILALFKIKTTQKSPPYKHIYFIEKPQNKVDLD